MAKPAIVQTVPAKVLTAEDNPSHCDESHQWIASEAPFYCIEKSYRSSSNRVKPAASYSNTYDYLSCTWYVKSRRPDIPDNWGNATDWMANARAIGWSTGVTPRAGAIGWRYGHVVYVESVGIGVITISERNYDYMGSYRERTALPSEFLYIY